MYYKEIYFLLRIDICIIDYEYKNIARTIYIAWYFEISGQISVDWNLIFQFFSLNTKSIHVILDIDAYIAIVLHC